MTVIVYSKPNCVQCTATTRALNEKNIAYTTIDLTQDASAMEMVAGLGYRQVPVIVAGEQHWAGYRPEKIRELCA